MKKNDIAAIVLIASVSLVASYFIGSAIIGEPKKSAAQVEVVEPISATIEQPQARTFNKDAINPTVVIQIGNPGNQQPFSGN